MVRGMSRYLLNCIARFFKVCAMKTHEHLGLRIDSELKQGLLRAAQAEDRSVSYIVTRAVREWVAQNERQPCEDCLKRSRLRGYRVCSDCWGDRPAADVLDVPRA